MSKERLYIFDTTLRDGAQTQGVDFSLEDKEKIASALDNLGVDYIEAGWPGANPTDTEFFQKKHNFKNSKLTSFGMTKRSGRSAENDTGLSALMNSNTSAVCLVGKSWDFHVDVALGISNEENLENISESAKHFVKAKKEFMFDAEHFFDGYKANPKYALSCIKALIQESAYFGFALYPSKKCSASNINSFFALTKCLALSLIFSKFSSLEIPKATSTWKSQDLPTKQTAEVFEFMSADKPVSFSALLPDLLVIPNDVNFEFLKLCFFWKNSVSVGLAPGHPASI